MEEAIKTLLRTGNEALIAFTKRNLLGEKVDIETYCAQETFSGRIAGKE